MANKKRNIKVLRPNIMWFWTLLTFAILGYWMFGTQEFEPIKSDWHTIKPLVERGAVDKITVVNRDVARVSLNEKGVDSLRNSDIRYKNLLI